MAKAKAPGAEQLAVSARLKALYEALEFKTQQEIADASSGAFTREQFNQAVNQSNTLAKSDKWIGGIAKVAAVDFQTSSDFLRGRITLEQLLERRASSEMPPPMPAPQASLRRQLSKRAKERDLAENVVDRACSARGFHGIASLEKHQLDALLDLAMGFERGTELLLRSIVRDAGTDNPLDDITNGSIEKRSTRVRR